MPPMHQHAEEGHAGGGEQADEDVAATLLGLRHRRAAGGEVALARGRIERPDDGAAEPRPPGAVRSRTERWLENELIELTRRCSVRERTHETRYTAHTTARITSTTSVTLRAYLR